MSGSTTNSSLFDISNELIDDSDELIDDSDEFSDTKPRHIRQPIITKSDESECFDYIVKKRDLNIKKPYNILREDINNILRAYPLNTETLQKIENAYSKFNDNLYNEIIKEEPDIHKINIDLYNDNKKLNKQNSQLRTSSACMSSVIKKLKKTNEKLKIENSKLKANIKDNDYWASFNYSLMITLAACCFMYVLCHILFN